MNSSTVFLYCLLLVLACFSSSWFRFQPWDLLLKQCDTFIHWQVHLVCSETVSPDLIESYFAKQGDPLHLFISVEFVSDQIGRFPSLLTCLSHHGFPSRVSDLLQYMRSCHSMRSLLYEPLFFSFLYPCTVLLPFESAKDTYTICHTLFTKALSSCQSFILVSIDIYIPDVINRLFLDLSIKEDSALHPVISYCQCVIEPYLAYVSTQSVLIYYMADRFATWKKDYASFCYSHMRQVNTMSSTNHPKRSLGDASDSQQQIVVSSLNHDDMLLHTFHHELCRAKEEASNYNKYLHDAVQDFPLHP
jgi:hypothetical protein